MTTGVTDRNWIGKAALTQDGEARAVLEPGGEWISANPVDGLDFLAASQAGTSIGEGHFADMFADWNLPDLEGWFLRNDPARPFGTYAKARAWAQR